MTQLITARKLTKSEMRAIQGGVDPAPTKPATPPPEPAPKTCDNAAGRGYTYDTDHETVIKCPTSKCFPDKPQGL
jgi:hypothetical protein